MLRWAEAAEAIAATPSKLAKVEALAQYLRDLDVSRLMLAVRYFAGRVFPVGDSRTVGVGGAALSSAFREVAAIDDTELGRVWRRHADAGDSVYELLSRGRSRTPAEARGHTDAESGAAMDLREVDEWFGALASADGTLGRAAALREMLARCSPLEGKYLVKLITGDLRIGLREGLVEEAVARAFGRDPAAVSRASMVLGDIGDAAVLAAEDGLSSAAPRLFVPLRFMLASPVADAAEAVRRLGEEVWVEDKYDGIRCQLHRTSSRVVLFSRDLRDVTAQFPEVAAGAASLGHDLILDGELLAFREGAVLPFQALQRRLGRVSPPPAIVEEIPVIFVAWDLLWEDGASYLDHPLDERRRRLEGLALGGKLATAHLENARGSAEVESLFEDARARLNEGLMVKNPSSPYTPGRRGLHWLKIKRPLDTLDVVVVAAEWGNGRRAGVLSDVTFAVLDESSGKLVPIGKAYTGLRDDEIAEMTQLLLDITVRDHGHHRWVSPLIVLEIAFDRVQRSERHSSGYALRFPRIVRWRQDKMVADIDTLDRVRALASGPAREREQLVDQAPV